MGIRLEKIFIIVVLCLLVIIGVIIYDTQFKEKKYTSEAIVSKKQFYTETIIETINKEKMEIPIYFLEEGTKLNADYIKKGTKLTATKIKPIFNLEEERKFISNITSGITMRKYREMITGIAKDETNEYNLSNINAFPIKIGNQYYEIDIDFNRMYQLLSNGVEKGQDGLFMHIKKDCIVTMTLPSSFKVISLENVENGVKKEILYEVNGNSFIFESLDTKGLYYARLQLENGDIIEYIFP